MARTRNPAPTTPDATETPVGRDLLIALYAALGALLDTTAAEEPAADPAPARRGRAAKPEPEPSLEDDDGLGGGDDGLGGGDDGLGDPEPEATTVEQVRDEFKKILKKMGDKPGREKITAILKKFGAKDIPSLDSDNYDAAITLAKKFQ